MSKIKRRGYEATLNHTNELRTNQHLKVAGQDPLPIFMGKNYFSNLYIKLLLGLSNYARHRGEEVLRLRRSSNSQGPDVRDQRLK